MYSYLICILGVNRSLKSFKCFFFIVLIVVFYIYVCVLNIYMVYV